MALVVTLYKKEEKILSRFYDKHTGCWYIPMIELSEEILNSLLTLMKYKKYLITGICDFDGEATITDFENTSILGYIVHKQSDLRAVEGVRTPQNLDIISKHLSLARYKFPTDWEEMKNFRIPKKDYYASTRLQLEIDQILYEGMLNTHLKDGYSICLGYNAKNEFYFVDALEVDW